MNVHKNARLTPLGRERIVRQVASGQTPKAVGASRRRLPADGAQMGRALSSRRPGGTAGSQSRPHRLHRPTPQAIVEQVERLRRQRWTGKQIAAEIGVSPATVSRILKRLGLNKLSALEPAEPVRRYEREHPGELIHIDIKKLGRFGRVGHRITGDPARSTAIRGIGWEFVHVCIDDASRLAFSQIMPDERKDSAVAFLKAAVAYYASLGVTHRARDDRQRLLLPVQGLPRSLQAPRPAAHLHQALHAEDQRQGRALHPDQPCANGPTPKPTTTQTSEPPNCRTGSTATTGIAHMAASKANTTHQPPRSTENNLLRLHS